MNDSAPRRIGLIGLDTSHVIAFTQLLHDQSHPYHLSGWRVTDAWPGGTPDWPISIDRVPGFREQLETEHGVTMHDSPAQVAEAVDLVLVTAVDGRVHRDLAEQVIPVGRPVFIDKPFATTLDDARAIVDLADRQGVALMSCSALRYAQALREAHSALQEAPVQAMQIFGPLAFQQELPGLFWYGCHAIEAIVAVMGTAVTHVEVQREGANAIYLLHFADGRHASYHGLGDKIHNKFGTLLHTADGYAFADISGHAEPFYASMLRVMLDTLPQGESPIPPTDMLEVIRVIEMCNAEH